MALALDAEIISEFLSSYDFSELPSVQHENSCSGDSSSDSGPEKQAPGTRHKLYRKRCREERESLEQEINELNLKLEMEPRRQLSMSGWRMVSKCHFAARLVSEERQRRLYATVSAQSALIHHYQGLIQGSLVPDGILPIRMDRHYHHKKMRVENFDTAFFKASFDTVDAIYAQTDEIFEKIGIDATGDNCATFTKAMVSDSGETHFQYLDKRKFPASFKQACSTVVRSIELHQKNDQVTYDGMEQTTGAYKFRVSASLEPGQEASVLLRVLNCRYHEDHRMVTVWRAFAEGEGVFLGMHADEIGWAIVTPSIEADGSSLMRRFARYVPMNFNSVKTEDKALTELFSKMVIDASTQNSEELACRVVKLLLNEK